MTNPGLTEASIAFSDFQSREIISMLVCDRVPRKKSGVKSARIAHGKEESRYERFVFESIESWNIYSKLRRNKQRRGKLLGISVHPALTEEKNCGEILNNCDTIC